MSPKQYKHITLGAKKVLLNLKEATPVKRHES